MFRTHSQLHGHWRLKVTGDCGWSKTSMLELQTDCSSGTVLPKEEGLCRSACRRPEFLAVSSYATPTTKTSVGTPTVTSLLDPTLPILLCLTKRRRNDRFLAREEGWSIQRNFGLLNTVRAQTQTCSLSADVRVNPWLLVTEHKRYVLLQDPKDQKVYDGSLKGTVLSITSISNSISILCIISTPANSPPSSPKAPPKTVHTSFTPSYTSKNKQSSLLLIASSSSPKEKSSTSTKINKMILNHSHQRDKKLVNCLDR